MIDNKIKIIETMQSSFPHIYDVYNKNTILYTLISIFGERYGISTNIIDRLYAMIGIDSTYDEDLEHRWGSLLGVYHQNGESYDDYRNRLLIVYASLSGGTAEAIKYAIASVVGITTDDDIINDYIKVYDAWEYPYEIDTDKYDTSYGHIICTVDLQANENLGMMSNGILNAINMTKASGIYPYLLFIYNANESVTLKYVEEDTLGRVADNMTDDIPLDIDINNHDNILTPIIDEYTSITKSLIWSGIGTNYSDAVLNSGFVTNMFMEVDEHTDIIIRGITILGKAVIGESAIGEMPF